jgi:predicted HTH transcriptional regulator
VYLRHNDSVTNSEYRRLNRVDTTAAGQELRGLVQVGLVEQKGVGRWTTYTLETSLRTPKGRQPEKDEDKILAYVKKHSSINNTECRELLGVDDTRAYYLLNKLCKINKIKPEGKGKGRQYVMP